jgi:hypothetical protein
VITAERPSAAEIADVDDPKSRLFVAAHRWALDSASVTTVACGFGVHARRFDLRLATVPALVVTKTHALVGRRAGKEDKLGSDLLDLVLLLERFDDDATVNAELAAAPYGLLGLARQLMGAFFADEQQLTRALGRAGKASGGASVNVERMSRRPPRQPHPTDSPSPRCPIWVGSTPSMSLPGAQERGPAERIIARGRVGQEVRLPRRLAAGRRQVRCRAPPCRAAGPRSAHRASAGG